MDVHKARKMQLIKSMLEMQFPVIWHTPLKETVLPVYLKKSPQEPIKDTA